MNPVTITDSGPALSKKELGAFEQRIGAELPEDYREFLLKTNGGKPNPKRFDTADKKIESLVVNFFSLRDVPPSLDSEFIDFTQSKKVPSSLLPIAIDPIKNRILLAISGENANHVFYWSLDEEDEDHTASFDYMRRISDSFSDFLKLLRK